MYAYNDWRISTFSFFGEQHAGTANRLRELRRMMRDDHQVKFTHGDISLRNIHVKIVGDRAEDVSVVALLDWEQAGWRPEYWEMIKFRHGAFDDSQWLSMGGRSLIPGYDTELAIEEELLLISGPL
jgi:aminoglycoside phosphotransferase (APT) family kinase protein